jgi:hypothetical protein
MKGGKLSTLSQAVNGAGRPFRSPLSPSQSRWNRGTCELNPPSCRPVTSDRSQLAQIVAAGSPSRFTLPFDPLAHPLLKQAKGKATVTKEFVVERPKIELLP